MENRMFAAVLHAPADLRYEQVKIPDFKDNEVLIRVRAAGVCGSDLGRVMKTGTYTLPLIPGHEFCGEVAEVGKSVTGHAPHDRVVVAPLLPCMQCEFCARGAYGMCDAYSYLGSRKDGAFAQFAVAPAQNLLHLPDGVSFAEGASVEPAAVTLHGMMRVGINVGDTIAVLGCGPIGLFAIQFARIMGARRIIAADIAKDKLALAETVGADESIDSSEFDTVDRIKDSTNGKGVDVAIETAGVGQTQEQCIRSTKKKGRLLYLGTAHRDVVIPPRTFECIVRNELSIFGSWNSYSAPFPGIEWPATIDFIEKGLLKIRPLITHTFDLSEARRVFDDLAERRFTFTKVIFEIP
jgi:L-iditol 2-dehydrogenase